MNKVDMILTRPLLTPQQLFLSPEEIEYSVTIIMH